MMEPWEGLSIPPVRQPRVEGARALADRSPGFVFSHNVVPVVIFK